MLRRDSKVFPVPPIPIPSRSATGLAFVGGIWIGIIVTIWRSRDVDSWMQRCSWCARARARERCDRQRFLLADSIWPPRARGFLSGDGLYRELAYIAREPARFYYPYLGRQLVILKDASAYPETGSTGWLDRRAIPRGFFLFDVDDAILRANAPRC